jgi:hypothetical protein
LFVALHCTGSRQEKQARNGLRASQLRSLDVLPRFGIGFSLPEVAAGQRIRVLGRAVLLRSGGIAIVGGIVVGLVLVLWLILWLGSTDPSLLGQ